MSGLCRYIILDAMEDNEEFYIPFTLNNEGPGLWLEGYENWDVGISLHSDRKEFKNNEWSLLLGLF